MIDVLTLNYNDAETTIQFVESVKRYDCVAHILVVDNKSTDNSFFQLSQLNEGKVTVVQTEKNGGYGAGNNFGIRYLSENFHSDYILLCNPDVLIEEKTCIELEKFLQNHNDYVIAAPFMLNAKKVRQYNTAFRIPTLFEYICSLEILFSKFIKPFYYKNIENNSIDYKDVCAVSGSLFLMNSNKMLQYGMYDERIFLYCEEVVLGLKFQKAKQKLALLPNLTFIHNHSISINKSFESVVAKHKLLMQSKLFVIKNYFKANFVQYVVAWLMSRLSVFEIRLISLIRECK